MFRLKARGSPCQEELCDGQFHAKVKLSPLPNNCKKHLRTIEACLQVIS